MKLLLHYHKSLSSFNIPFSLFAGGFGYAMNGNTFSGYMTGFLLSLLSGGFLLSVFFYELRYASRYYFYYNKGYSKIQLAGFSYLLNVGLWGVYQVVKYIALW